MHGLLPEGIYNLLAFIAVIAPLVTVHEFGHYLAGRAFGVKAETFSIGFGKELLGFTDRRGTRWKLSAIPFGGYVKFAGDANAASLPGDVSHMPPEERARTLNVKPLWQRATIIAAGPFTNFLFAALLLAGLYTAVGQARTDTGPMAVGTVQAGSAAAAAGLRTGDVIGTLDGQAVKSFADFAEQLSHNRGVPVRLDISRGGDALVSVVMPQAVTRPGANGKPVTHWMLGVGPPIERVDPFTGLWMGTRDVARAIPAMGQALIDVATGARGFSELAGPVKMVQISGEQAAQGAGSLVWFIALVSINLGFINLLPIPVLDGGHLAMYAIEGVRRRPLSQRAQELAFMSGFAALFTFMIAKTLNDLSSFELWHRLAGVIG